MGIVESIGDIGAHERSDNRLVCTGMSDLDTSIAELRKKGKQNQTPTRVQIKTTYPPGELSEALRGKPTGGGFATPEAVFTTPLGSAGVIFWGSNSRSRREYLKSTQDLKSTQEHEALQKQLKIEWASAQEYFSQAQPITVDGLLSFYHKKLAQGFRPTIRFQESDATAIYALWKQFGWSQDGVAQFLQNYRSGNAGYAAGVRHGGKIVAMAKAERLQLKGIDLIESTEWATDPDVMSSGTCSLALMALHGQVVSDPSFNPCTTLLMAETNMSPEARAYKAGYRSGLAPCGDMKSKNPSGVLPLHVTVGNRRRNFLAMQLYPQAIDPLRTVYQQMQFI